MAPFHSERAFLYLVQASEGIKVLPVSRGGNFHSHIISSSCAVKADDSAGSTAPKRLVWAASAEMFVLII